ncbi:TPA: hypothetical protein ACTYFT_004977, partial [Escherichia coli]
SFFEELNLHCFLTEQALQLFYLFVVVNKNWSQFQFFSSIYFPIRSAVIHRYIHEAGVHYKSVCVNRLLYVAIKPVLVT